MKVYDFYFSSTTDKVAVIGLIGKSSLRGAPWGDKGASLSLPPHNSHFPKTPSSHVRIYLILLFI